VILSGDKTIDFDLNMAFGKTDMNIFTYTYTVQESENGAFSGWIVYECGKRGITKECCIDPDGHVSQIAHYDCDENPIGSTKPGSIILLKRFDKAGKIIVWKEWYYCPEDGLGWSWYMTEYDENGNVVYDEYKGQA